MHKKQGQISRFKPSHLSLEKIGYAPIASVRLLQPEVRAGTREIITTKVSIARKWFIGAYQQRLYSAERKEKNRVAKIEALR